MKRVLATLGLVASFWAPAFSQTAPPTSQFEAADVHVSPPDATTSGAFLPKGRVEFRANTMLHLIMTAYSVRIDQVSGGPSWLDTDRFDVIAQAASSPSQIEMRTMLQGLLAERFGLEIKREEKPMPVYALVLAGRPPKESAGGETECQTGSEDNVRTFTCHNVTIANLGQRLQLATPGYFNLPTVDRTGLKGTYDCKLSYLPRAQLPPGAAGNNLSLFTAIEKQLGVRVERQTEPMPVLTVVRVNRTPSANPPGVTEALAPPKAFEVADIRPSRTNENPDANINNGRIEAHALTLKDFIAVAYSVEDDQDRLRGGERWLGTDRFDIVAKTEPTASIDTLRVMLQNLLAERFHLKVHKELEPVTVYALTAVKPKVKDADPSTRDTCKVGAADGGRMITCQNTTMAQFADKLRNYSTGYLEHPVVDLTGLNGAYDFALTFTPRAALERVGGGKNAKEDATPAGGAIPMPADRAVGLTIFEAIERQLGLKLAAQKHPMPVIVIDHVDRTPTAN
jgi:uncharacterized protein (TIGR03435 family)